MLDKKEWEIKGGYSEGELTKVYQTVRNAQGGFDTIIFDEKEIVFQIKDKSDKIFAISYSDIDSYFLKKGMIITKLKSGKIFTFWLRHRGRRGSVSTKNAKKFMTALDEFIA